jgi:hypothetical protein
LSFSSSPLGKVIFNIKHKALAGKVKGKNAAKKHAKVVIFLSGQKISRKI